MLLLTDKSGKYFEVSFSGSKIIYAKYLEDETQVPIDELEWALFVYKGDVDLYKSRAYKITEN